MIKRNLTFIAALLISIATYAQNTIPTAQVPVSVSSAFTSKFPTATSVVWEQQQQVYFIPRFTVVGIATSALIDLKGQIIHTATEMSAASLPVAATAYLHTNFSGQTASYAALIAYTGSTVTRYEVKIAGKDLIFDSNGKFVSVANGLFK